MAKSRLNIILSHIVDIRPGEKTIAFLLFFYFFLIMFPYYIIKSLRDAKYLEEAGALYLPVAYLLTAVVMGFFVAFYSRLQVKIHRRALIISSLVVFIVTCLLFRQLFYFRIDKTSLVFWVWANIYIVVLGTQFWILVNDVFNPREARRLIGFFGSGGLLGGVLGGLLTGYLGEKIPEYLLFIAAGILFFSVFVLNYIFIWQKKRKLPILKVDNAAIDRGKEPAKVGFLNCFNTVRKNNSLI